MKTAVNFSTARGHVPYPNAASRAQVLHRFLDLALMAAIGAGLAASLMFLLVIF